MSRIRCIVHQGQFHVDAGGDRHHGFGRDAIILGDGESAEPAEREDRACLAIQRTLQYSPFRGNGGGSSAKRLALMGLVRVIRINEKGDVRMRGVEHRLRLENEGGPRRIDIPHDPR